MCEFKTYRGRVGEGASQVEPIGRHNAHHAFDFMTLNDSTEPTNPYTIDAAIARPGLGMYPMGLSVPHPR